MTVLAIDAGTTGITALILTPDGTITGRGYSEFSHYFPDRLINQGMAADGASAVSDLYRFGMWIPESSRAGRGELSRYGGF